ncbi:hypothetical protein F0562_019278 [Nyssa sinensis]|uniref:Pentacotripeptide-repeat region of PRORP domain-containing protein n=1 Tax=Nyssa sinensis TaxID=561372 RepID=A0A5J4ZDS5_9ASTE|nr:hypothetical protein F0562_019278 [Nyssa sinensis]
MKGGCSPDAVVYYTLISGLSLAGRKNKWDKAYAMLKEMEQDGVKPDGVTYNNFISFSATRDFTTTH